MMSICLPNMSQISRRAHPHRTAALFTNLKFIASASLRDDLETKPAAFELFRGGRGKISRIINSDDTTLAVNDDLLISTMDKNGLSARPHLRKVMPLSQVQLRQDVYERGYRLCGSQTWVTHILENVSGPQSTMQDSATELETLFDIPNPQPSSPPYFSTLHFYTTSRLKQSNVRSKNLELSRPSLKSQLSQRCKP